MIQNSVKSYLKRTPLYRQHFARKNTLDLNNFTEDEFRQCRLYAQFVCVFPEMPLVFDIGANVGTHSKLFRRLGCRVIAVEPQRACVAALKRTFGSRIEVVHAAASNGVGTADLNLCEVSAVASMSTEWIETTKKNGRFPGLVWGQRETVEALALDILIQIYGKPCFIKLDVEGHEWHVLRGLSYSVPALCFEATPEMAKVAINCVSRLGDIGTYEFNYSIGDDAILEFSKWLDPKSAVDYLARIDRRGDVYARTAHGTPHFVDK